MTHKHDWKAVAKRWQWLTGRDDRYGNHSKWLFTVTWACSPPCGQFKQTSATLPMSKP